MSKLTLNKFNFYKILRKLISSSNLFVAYSGGVDSQVLLYLLHEVQSLDSSITITAIHIDHGLSDYSEQWSEHCLKFCKLLNITCLVKKVAVKSKLTNKHSTEALARDLRYQAIAEILPENAALLTAHHTLDQAETLLLQLFRGAGPKGLASIPSKIFFGKNSELIRPLLSFSRNEILSYAKEHNLQWIEDESNLDITIDRNYVRLNLFPLLNKRWQGIEKTLGRVAQNCAEVSELLDELAKKDILQVPGTLQNTLSVSRLHALSESRQRNVIRYWLLRKMHLPIPSSIKVLEIQKNILHSASDRNPLVHWQGAEVRRYRDNIYAMAPLTKHNYNLIFSWDFKKNLQLPSGLGYLKAALTEGTSKIDVTKITVRFRQGGEKCKLLGRSNHYYLLKHLFQEWGIPPWQRDRIPLIYFADELICIVGYAKAFGWENLDVTLVF